MYGLEEHSKPKHDTLLFVNATIGFSENLILVIWVLLCEIRKASWMCLHAL